MIDRVQVLSGLGVKARSSARSHGSLLPHAPDLNPQCNERLPSVIAYSRVMHNPDRGELVPSRRKLRPDSSFW